MKDGPYSHAHEHYCQWGKHRWWCHALKCFVFDNDFHKGCGQHDLDDFMRFWDGAFPVRTMMGMEELA